MQAVGLSNHVLDNNVVNFAYGIAVFQHFPRLVCVEVNFYHVFVAYNKQAVAFDVLRDVVGNFAVVQVLVALVDKQLCVVAYRPVLLSGDSAFYVDVLFKLILRKISIPFYKEISNRILLVVRFDE